MKVSSSRNVDINPCDGARLRNDSHPNTKMGFRTTVSTLVTKGYCSLRSDSGQGVAEYIIILAVIVIACIALAIAFKGQLTELWNTVTGALGGI